MEAELPIRKAVDPLEHGRTQNLLGAHRFATLAFAHPGLQILQNPLGHPRIVSEDPVDPIEFSGVGMIHHRARQRKLFSEKLAHSGCSLGRSVDFIVRNYQSTFVEDKALHPGAQLFLYSQHLTRFGTDTS